VFIAAERRKLFELSVEREQTPKRSVEQLRHAELRVVADWQVEAVRRNWIRKALVECLEVQLR